MGTTPQKVRDIIKISQEPVSLESPIGDEGDSQFGDFIEDHDGRRARPGGQRDPAVRGARRSADDDDEPRAQGHRAALRSQG